MLHFGNACCGDGGGCQVEECADAVSTKGMEGGVELRKAAATEEEEEGCEGEVGGWRINRRLREGRG